MNRKLSAFRHSRQNFRHGTVRQVLNKRLAEMGIPEPPSPAEETLELVDIFCRRTT